MAGLRWLWLIGTAGGIVVLSAALSFGTRQTGRRGRRDVTPEPAASDPGALAAASGGYAGNKPRLRDRYVAGHRDPRWVP